MVRTIENLVDFMYEHKSYTCYYKVQCEMNISEGEDVTGHIYGNPQYERYTYLDVIPIEETMTVKTILISDEKNNTIHNDDIFNYACNFVYNKIINDEHKVEDYV